MLLDRKCIFLKIFPEFMLCFICSNFLLCIKSGEQWLHKAQRKNFKFLFKKLKVGNIEHFYMFEKKRKEKIDWKSHALHLARATTMLCSWDSDQLPPTTSEFLNCHFVWIQRKLWKNEIDPDNFRSIMINEFHANVTKNATDPN